MTELDRCWKNCLRMWKWIAEQVSDAGVTLKYEWLGEHYKGIAKPSSGCFFCDHTMDADGLKACHRCPGRLVDEKFQCDGGRYDYRDRPKAFYAKLLELDAKRRASND